MQAAVVDADFEVWEGTRFCGDGVVADLVAEELNEVKNAHIKVKARILVVKEVVKALLKVRMLCKESDNLFCGV